MTRARSLAIIGSIVTVTLFALSIPLLVASGSGTDPFGVVYPIPFVAMALIGALIVTRQRRHTVGWLFLAAGSLSIANAFARAYAMYSYEGPGPLPGAAIAAWSAIWTWMPSTSFLALVFVLFPTGSARGRAWRWVSRVMVLLIGLTVIAAVPLLSVPGRTLHELNNPSEVSAGYWLALLSNGPVPALLLVGFVALVVRFVRSRGVERLQMKWFVLGGCLLAIAAAVPFFSSSDDPINTPIGLASVMVGMTAIPVTSAIAILRYRLYNIDRIISRTVSYALVTATLGGLFALVALAPTAVIGTEDSPDWVIAAATLAVVATFRPVRARVQRFVDRRFDRLRYDAARTIEGFASRLREEVDVDALGAELRDVVVSTVHPSHVSLWLRERGRA